MAAHVWAQTQTGQISGVVTDLSGKPIHNVSAHAVALDTGESREIKVSDAGRYTFFAVPAGRYAVTVSAAGFQDVLERLDVPAGGVVQERIVLLAEGAANASVSARNVAKELRPETRRISEMEVRELPNLTRDVYRLSELAGNVSEAGLGTRGVGVAMNGQWESSTAILVDGVYSRDEFNGDAVPPPPLDSVGEFAVMPGSFPAMYGRASGGVVQLTGRRGSEALHGSLYEFNRVSSLASGSYQNNAQGVKADAFHQNQFGGAVGGRVFGRKLFFFTNLEITRIRSEATQFAWVATPELLARSSANTQSYFQTLGQLRSNIQTLGTVSLGQLTAMAGRSPCTGLLCATLPATLPLFTHVAYKAATDAGAGFPQNTWNTYNRVDYNRSDRTRLFVRYGLYREDDQSGVLSNSPYADYDLSRNQNDNSVLLSGTHEWSARVVSQNSVAFDRITLNQQGLTKRGVVPSMYANPIAPVTIAGDPVEFPGYNPLTPGVGGTFGGPENTLQVNHDTGWSLGRHTLHFGGTYFYLRDNRTNAAYQTAVDSLANNTGLGGPLVGLVNGTFAQIQVAVDAQGQFPCGSAPTCSIALPVSSPAFSRSNRFHDGALYAQDRWQLSRRISVDAGVRWDYFGVQHNKNPKLDSNWYSNVSNADTDLIHHLVFGALAPAGKSSVGGLYAPDRNNFAPRVGIAWDVFGDGRTVARGGFGIGYDRNFGNVTFNVLQNLPNYSVLSLPGPITTNNFGPLSGSGTLSLPLMGARIINPNLRTAYAEFWNASVQREFGRSLIYSVEYSGSKGVDLYSVSYPNQKGFRNSKFGDACTGNGDCRTSPNPYYAEDVGYRGNQGFSNYYAVNHRVTTNNLFHSGVALTATYTWSHAVDNLSSTFFEAGGQIANRYGNRNITVNNGLFDAGFLDPFDPNLDRGDAEFDVRHRVTVSGVWTVPGLNKTGWLNTVTSGWTLAPLFVGRSGQPFSVFDSVAQTLDLNTPRATLAPSASKKRNTFVPAPTPDLFHIITFLPSQILHQPNLLTPGSGWPGDMTKRDAFRAPGFWNFDLALSKNTKLRERLALELRIEAFNVFNHANLYVIGASANVGSGNTVDACFGCTGSTYDRRQLQMAARFIF